MPFDKLPSWTNQKAWCQLPLIERALMLAAARVGERETKRNSSTWVDLFLRAVGLAPGYAWCASFVYWCLTESGWPAESLPEKRRAAGVITWSRWAEERGLIVSEPRRGDLMFWVNPDGTGHIGFVTKATKTEVFTIEGNTNDAGSREGDGVYRKTRRISPKLRFISLHAVADRLTDRP